MSPRPRSKTTVQPRPRAHGFLGGAGAVPCRSVCRQTARDGTPTGSSSHSTEKWSYLNPQEGGPQQLGCWSSSHCKTGLGSRSFCRAASGRFRGFRGIQLAVTLGPHSEGLAWVGTLPLAASCPQGHGQLASPSGRDPRPGPGPGPGVYSQLCFSNGTKPRTS